MNITAILPVSRVKYLDRVLDSLASQTHRPNSLLVVVEGDDREYLEVKNRVESFSFDDVLCIKSPDSPSAHTIPERRKKIAALHNRCRKLVGEADWVFSIEDDGILPSDALEKLVQTATSKPNVGMVTGVELGRWGVPYVGAWVVDNVYDVQTITSLENMTHDPLVEEIDACGLYCALIRAENYKSHDFYCTNGLGPDVNLGLYLRMLGFTNCIDWSVHITHLGVQNGEEVEIKATDPSKVVKMSMYSKNTWRVLH